MFYSYDNYYPNQTKLNNKKRFRTFQFIQITAKNLMINNLSTKCFEEEFVDGLMACLIKSSVTIMDLWYINKNVCLTQ